MKDRRTISLLIASSLLVFVMSACNRADDHGTEDSETEVTWQEQYDLGVRYLSEGNYQEAILAFTAAIEIDPKQAPAYVGRGDAYVGLGGTEENLAAAKTDYETAIELDETSTEAYLGLADVYIRQGDYEKAQEILSHAISIIGDNWKISAKLSEISLMIYPRTNRAELGGGRYMIEEYNEHGQIVTRSYYDANDVMGLMHEYYYDILGELAHYILNDYMVDTRQEIFYENGQIVKSLRISPPSGYEIAVQYSGTTAEITYHIWEDERSTATATFLGMDSTTTKTFTMLTPENSVGMVSGSWDIETGFHITRILEYRKEAPHRTDSPDKMLEAIREVTYATNGDVESDIKY